MYEIITDLGNSFVLKCDNSALKPITTQLTDAYVRYTASLI